MNSEDLLIIGYGNRWRSDDGIGPMLAERIQALNIQGVRCLAKTILAPEDVIEILQCSTVIFIDATMEEGHPYSLFKMEPNFSLSFSSGIATPEFLLSLCHWVFNKKITGYMLSVQGYNWIFAEGLSFRAQKNLEEAYTFIMKMIDELHGDNGIYYNDLLFCMH